MYFYYVVLTSRPTSESSSKELNLSSYLIQNWTRPDLTWTLPDLSFTAGPLPSPV